MARSGPRARSATRSAERGQRMAAHQLDCNLADGAGCRSSCRERRRPARGAPPGPSESHPCRQRADSRPDGNRSRRLVRSALAWKLGASRSRAGDPRRHRDRVDEKKSGRSPLVISRLQVIQPNDFQRAGDRTRSGDVQLGKEAEKQGLTLPSANFPLGSGVWCAVRQRFIAGNTSRRPPTPPRAGGTRGADPNAHRVRRVEPGRLPGIDTVALAEALARPWADLVLSGAATPGQLRSNLRALERPWDDTAETRLGGLALEPRQYWARRAKLPWT
jgi:hypothetical protein